MDAQKAIRSLALVHKPLPEVVALVGTVRAWLEERGCTVATFPNTADVRFETMDIDAVVAFGGDGTMLGVARRLTSRPVPVLGVNLGSVGFLTEINVKDWQPALERFVRGQYRLIKRMALRWKVWREGRLVSEGHAVNDAVMSRGALSRVVRFGVKAGGQDICTVRADGLIISSPMGASGYAVSAGGPLVHPALPAVVITPICPFLCNFPPLVLPLSLPVRVETLSSSVQTFLTLDGQRTVSLAPYDVVEVSGERKLVHYARIGEGTYFKRLKARGFIEDYVHSAPQAPCAPDAGDIGRQA